MAIEEKAVVAIATKTPAPIFVALGIVAIWILIFIVAKGLCTSVRSTYI